VAPITPNRDFYVVTKNLVDPRVLGSVWRLRVGGLVDRPYELTASDLAAMPRVEREATLECISNGVGYGLLSNAVWGGVTMGSLLDRASPLGAARWVNLRAADGYTHSLALERARRPATLVADTMNGEPLPDLHGFPARAIVPGTYGEVNVKWLTELDLTDQPVAGYYELQGWRPDFVQTMSRIDDPAKGAVISLAASPLVTLRGVAFSGDRGISSVEISWEAGRWRAARIDYHPSPNAWALWSFDWRPPGPGRYLVQARATDGGGTPQEAEPMGTVPAGATGYHTRQIVVVP
jgi:DMSO/TMAO reductase YedYZ molybdopterin-dependent catalytic subunit